MWLFEKDKSTLQPSLKNSMEFLYKESDQMESLTELIPYYPNENKKKPGKPQEKRHSWWDLIKNDSFIFLLSYILPIYSEWCENEVVNISRESSSILWDALGSIGTANDVSPDSSEIFFVSTALINQKWVAYESISLHSWSFVGRTRRKLGNFADPTTLQLRIEETAVTLRCFLCDFLALWILLVIIKLFI